MSIKVVSFDELKKKEPQYKFIVKNIKIVSEDSNTGEITTDVEVVIKAQNIKTGKSRIHPYTEFLDRWKNCSIKHRMNKASNIVQFLNYIYFTLGEKVIPDISELDFEIGIDFLNQYSKKLSKSSSDKMERTVSEFYYFMAKKKLLKRVKLSDFTFTVVNDRGKTVMESPFVGKIKKNQEVHNKNKLHNIPTNLVVYLLEASQKVAPSISLGLYLQFFGGLRASEVVSIEYSDIALKGRAGRDGALIQVREKDLRPDNNSSFQAQVKKPRDQRILGLNGLFMKYFKNHKELYKQEGQDAVFLNRNGQPMDYQSYNYYFNKVKLAFIQGLRESGNPDFYTYALYLQTQDWSTHIGRGIFTNIVSEISNNAVELANMRGDSSLDAAIPYMTDTDAMDEKAFDLLNERCNRLFKDTFGEC
ncbi:Site-specific recombinase XerD [Turicibacter sanguinis]|nr:Site-specific recombinase XerD [Turicibacter sanguinis]